MTKAPVEGQVKTRLASDIGLHHATELYKCFLKDTLDKLKDTGIPVIIYYFPKQSKRMLTLTIGPNYHFVHQKGNNLGERLFNGFKKAKNKGYEYSIALSSDVPDISPNTIINAMDRLKNYPAVIGPCPDGGYYLIGFQLDQIEKDYFSRIQWGAKTVYKDTMKRMEDINIYICEQWRDVDTLEDLNDLLKKKNSSYTQNYVKRYIKL
jgi:rSAM/selenodomain-associated transferase 1